MKSLIVLCAIFFIVRGQLNQPCISNDTCQNTTNGPCAGDACICDPLSLTCRLRIGQSCMATGNFCQVGTICQGGVCLALEGRPCSEGLCVFGGDCVSGVCRAAPGFAWNPINQTYETCDPTCATCFLPGDSEACLSCADPAKSAINGICVCNTGAANGNGACMPCDPRCETCAVPQSPFGCTSCSLNTMTLISGVCFCPVGQAWNTATRNCELCHPSCATCSRPGNPNFCTSCFTGILIGGTCTNLTTPVVCRPGTAPNAAGVCLPCHYTCRTCLAPNNPTRCTSCVLGKRLVGGMCVPYKDVKYKKLAKLQRCPPLMASINGVCKCIRGYVGNSLSATASDTYCLPCDPSCLTCYAPENPNACTSCPRGYYLIGGVCTRTPLPPSPPPITCSPICRNCTVANNPYECTSCVMLNSQQRNGFCYCPAGSYNLSNVCVSPCDYPCTECFITNSSICTACPNGLLPLGGTCVCPNGTAFNDAGICAPCDVSCETCGQAGNPLACTSCTDSRATLVNGKCLCPDPLMTYNSSGLCVCPPNFIDAGGICILTVCPPGTFPSNGDCLPCTIPNCANCSSATTCSMCNPGYYLFNGLCYPCPPNCLTCNSSTVCTACRPGYILDQFGNCVRPCPACCPTCTFNALGQPVCLTCLNNFVFINGQCRTCSEGIPGCINCRNCACTKCMPGYFLFNATRCMACSAAIPNCEVCIDENTCIRCIPGYFFDVNLRRCIPSTTPPPPPIECPVGHFMDKRGNCVQCYYNCRTCIGYGPNMCTDCYPDSILYPEDGQIWGRCVCKGGYWFDDSRKCCQPPTVPKPKNLP